jgi:hypothetical protein
MRRTRRINSAMGRLVDTYTHNDLPPQFMSIMETASKAGYDTVVREYQNGYFTLEFRNYKEFTGVAGTCVAFVPATSILDKYRGDENNGE